MLVQITSNPPVCTSTSYSSYEISSGSFRCFRLWKPPAFRSFRIPKGSQRSSSRVQRTRGERYRGDPHWSQVEPTTNKRAALSSPFLEKNLACLLISNFSPRSGIVVPMKLDTSGVNLSRFRTRIRISILVKYRFQPSGWSGTKDGWFFTGVPRP